MVRPGKERMSLSAPGDDEATQMTTQDTRWLNGVNRQLRPDAAERVSREVSDRNARATSWDSAALETRRRGHWARP